VLVLLGRFFFNVLRGLVRRAAVERDPTRLLVLVSPADGELIEPVNGVTRLRPTVLLVVWLLLVLVLRADVAADAAIVADEEDFDEDATNLSQVVTSSTAAVVTTDLSPLLLVVDATPTVAFFVFWSAPPRPSKAAARAWRKARTSLPV